MNVYPLRFAVCTAFLFLILFSFIFYIEVYTEPMEPPPPHTLFAKDFNEVFRECQKNHESMGVVYSVKYIFVDGMIFNPEHVIENIRQCGRLWSRK